MDADTAKILEGMREERSRAAATLEALISNIGARVGDTVTARYQNGQSKTAVLNGWLETESGSRYLRLDTASVPPIYIVDIRKDSF